MGERLGEMTLLTLPIVNCPQMDADIVESFLTVAV